MTKPKICCQLSRRPDGEVFARMIGEDGQVLDTRFFGKFNEREFEHLIRVIELEMPEMIVADIKLSGN